MIENTDVQEFLKFINAAVSATKNDDRAEFECPLCNSTAVAVKASNGHVRAACDRCRANFIQ